MMFITRRLPRVLMLAGLLALLAASVVAQEEVDDEVVLPELPPEAVEIVGELQIVFPQLDRPALVGFNPPPKIYQVPRDRRPFIEDYKQLAASIPRSALDGAPGPESNSRSYGAGKNLLLDLSGGRYLARAIDLDVQKNLGRTGHIFAEVDYSGVGRFGVTVDTLTRNTDWRNLTGQVGVSTGGRTRLGVTLDGFSDGFELYGARRNEGLEDFKRYPERRGDGLGLTVSLSAGPAELAPIAVSLRYAGTNYTTLIDDDVADSAYRTAEKRIDAEAKTQLVFGGTRFVLDARGVVGGLDTDDFIANDHASYIATLRTEVGLGSISNILLGASLLGYSASELNQGFPGSGLGVESNTYLAPMASVSISPVESATLFVRARPELAPHGLRDIYALAPYAESEPLLKPSIATLKAEAGAVLHVGPVTLDVTGRVARYPEFLFFEQQNLVNGIYGSGIFSATYASAQVLSTEIGASIELPSAISASARIQIRNGKLTELDDAIPNFPGVVAFGHLSYEGLDGRLQVQADLRYESERYQRRDKSGLFGSYAALDLDASYFITERMAIFGRIDNLANSQFEKWINYPQPTLVTMGGLRIRF